MDTLSTYTLNLLFVLIKCNIPFTFHIVVRELYSVSQARSTVTTSHVSGASCYIIRGMLLYHTGHVVISYGASCYIIRGMLLHHTGHVVTSYGACCHNNSWNAKQV